MTLSTSNQPKMSVLHSENAKVNIFSQNDFSYFRLQTKNSATRKTEWKKKNNLPLKTSRMPLERPTTFFRYNLSSRENETLKSNARPLKIEIRFLTTSKTNHQSTNIEFQHIVSTVCRLSGINHNQSKRQMQVATNPSF